jgi:hypothetical protein
MMMVLAVPRSMAISCVKKLNKPMRGFVLLLFSGGFRVLQKVGYRTYPTAHTFSVQIYPVVIGLTGGYPPKKRELLTA